jgi:sugar phosphate isomerase/epimerase
MDRPPEAYLHVGIVHFMLFPDVQGGDGPVLESVQSLASDGFFHALELTRINDSQARTSVKRLAESAHFALGYGAHPAILSGGLDLSSSDDEKRAKSVDRVKAEIDEAHELGVALVTLLDGPNSAPAPGAEDAALARLADSLKQLCQHAGGYGMSIALEQFDRAIEKRSLCGPIDLCVRLSEMVRTDTPNFGLCLDLSHLPLLDEDPPASIRKAADHLVQVHIGNCVKSDRSHPQYGDQHPGFGVTGGENDVAELTTYLQALFEIGYFEKQLPTPMPLVSFEMKPAADESAAAIIGNCKRTFQQAWARV